MTPCLSHLFHRFIIQINPRIAQPPKSLLKTLLNQQITDRKHTFLLHSKGIIFKNYFLYIGEVLRNIFEFSHHIFWCSQTILMTMHRLWINTKITSCHASSSRENLDLWKCCWCKEIISWVQMFLYKLCCERNIIQLLYKRHIIGGAYFIILSICNSFYSAPFKIISDCPCQISHNIIKLMSGNCIHHFANI